MEEMVTGLDKTWMCGNEKESTPASRHLEQSSEMVDSGKALRTALPDFGQRLEMERKREEEGTSAESQVLNSLTLPSFALFFFFLLFHLLPFCSAQMPSI